MLSPLQIILKDLDDKSKIKTFYKEKWIDRTVKNGLGGVLKECYRCEQPALYESSLYPILDGFWGYCEDHCDPEKHQISLTLAVLRCQNQMNQVKS